MVKGIRRRNRRFSKKTIKKSKNITRLKNSLQNFYTKHFYRSTKKRKLKTLYMKSLKQYHFKISSISFMP